MAITGERRPASACADRGKPDLFVALVGDKHDAHDFVPAVLEQGALALVSRDLPRMLLAVSASNLEVCDYYLRLGYVVSEEPYAHAAPGRPAPVVFTKEL